MKNKPDSSVNVSDIQKEEAPKSIMNAVENKEVVEEQKEQKSLEAINKNDIIKSLEDRNEPSSQKQLELTIRAKKESWFNLVIDGKEEQDFILRENTGKTFLGNLRFKITVGNRRVVQLALNVKILNLPESEDNVLRDFLIEPGTSR